MKFYAQLMKKWELLHLTLDNSKSDKELGDYQDQIKNVQDKESSSYQFCAEGSSEGSLISEMSSEFLWISVF